MLHNIYPKDQIDRYLLLDLIAVVYLAYHLFIASHPFGFLWSFVLFILFLATYYFCLWYRDWRLLFSAILGLALVLILSMYYDPALLVLAFVQTDLIGRSRSKWSIGIVMLSLVAMYSTTFYVWEGHPLAFIHTLYLPILIVQLLVPIVIRIRQRSKSLEHALLIANKKIERYIQEEERNRIARDLHDTLGQTLTMISMKSELAIRMIDKKPEQIRHELNDVTDAARTALKQVRELVTSMKFVSLAEELEHAAKLFRIAGIELIIKEIDTVPPEFSSVAETMLALSLREACTNTIKHSQATTCTIHMKRYDDKYEMQIIDDGIGMNSEDNQGNGLMSMHERMRLVQGEANVVSPEEGGVTVTLRIPVHHSCVPTERSTVTEKGELL